MIIICCKYVDIVTSFKKNYKIPYFFLYIFFIKIKYPFILLNLYLQQLHALADFFFSLVPCKAVIKNHASLLGAFI